MKTRRTQLGLLALVLGAAGAARAAGQSCPHAEISKTRALAEQRMKAKDYAGAIAILKPLRDKCGLYSYREVNGERQADLDFYWIHSDLSFAYYRAGQLRECLSVLAELTYPGPPDGLSSNGLDDSPVAKAIAHNERLCETALLGRYGKLVEQRCPDIKRRDADDRSSIAVPDELSQGGKFRCLFLKGGAGSEELRRALDSGKEPDAKKLCPRVMAAGNGGQPALALPVDTGTLTDVSNCCLIDSISAGVVDGKPVVRLRGQGRDCFGGRAYFISDEIFEWRGSTLVRLVSASRIAH